MKNNQANLQVGKLITPSDITSSISLPDLFGPRSYILSFLLNEPLHFLSKPVSCWADDEGYCRLRNILLKIPAINDAAERAVLLAKSLHNKLAYCKKQKSNLYVTVPLIRKVLRKRKKSDVMSV